MLQLKFLFKLVPKYLSKYGDFSENYSGKNSILPKRDVLKAFVKGLKRAYFQKRFFSKKFSKKSFGHIKNLTTVFLYNLILLNRMALSESRSGARNMKIDLLPPKVVLCGLRILEALSHSIF